MDSSRYKTVKIVSLLGVELPRVDAGTKEEDITRG